MQYKKGLDAKYFCFVPFKKSGNSGELKRRVGCVMYGVLRFFPLVEGITLQARVYPACPQRGRPECVKLIFKHHSTWWC